MIFTDLHNALVERLKWDAYFAHPDRKVIALAENRMDLMSELDQQMAMSGIGSILAVPRVTLGEVQGEVIVSILLLTHEIPMLNRAEGMVRKSAFEVSVKAMTLWGGGWTPDENVWQPMEFQRLELTDVDEEHGRLTWALEYQTRTILETFFSVLAQAETADGSVPVLVNEDGAPLLVSPTEP